MSVITYQRGMETKKIKIALKEYSVILTINIFLWHKSEDINKKRLFPKFQLFLILRS